MAEITKAIKYTPVELKKRGFKQVTGAEEYFRYFKKDGITYVFRIIPSIGLHSMPISKDNEKLRLKEIL